MKGAYNMHGKYEKCTESLSETSEGKRLLSTSRLVYEDIIKVDVKETGREGVDCIYVARDIVQRWSLVDTTVKLQVSLKARNFFLA
jgi:hypothetical protein